jgi:hypothetical protein
MADSKVVAAANKKRPPNAGKGRTAGTPNKTTAALKDAILKAAELSGRDAKGKEGLVGYLRRVADEDVKAFSGLLGKVLPMTVQGAGPNGEHVFQKIVVEVVQAGK